MIHLYKVQEKPKLTYSNKYQNTGFIRRVGIAINWKGARVTFEGDGNVYIFICVVVTRLYR